MGKVIWSPTALADVDSIADYVARDSPSRAALLATRLMHAPDVLTTFTRMAGHEFFFRSCDLADHCLRMLLDEVGKARPWEK